MFILTFSGLDPSGGAGLHADVKTARAIGLHASSIVTALTVQNSCGVRFFRAVDVDTIEAQIRALEEDIEFSGVKIGMVPNEEIAACIADFIKKLDIPKVLDPVLSAGAGGELGSVEAYRKLLPSVNVITPNFSEAKILGGVDGSVEEVAKTLSAFGCDVVITGGELGGRDVVVDSGRIYRVEADFKPINIHGTGCVYSTALACFLAKGMELEDAVRKARIFTLESVKKALRVGKCDPFVNP